MFPTLQQLTLNTLIKFKQHLGDVGAAPVDLLDGVLSHCTAEELAEIEDGTREGSGRELSPWLWPYWRHLVVERFGEPPAGERLPQLPAAADVAFVPGQRPADFRALYSQRLAELERKKVESGARLRALREQEEQAKQARHVMVVDPMPRNRRQRSANGGAGAGAGSSGHRQIFQSPGQASTKDRLLKKLGIGKGGGSGSGSSSFVGSRGGAGQKTVIRPAGRPGAAAGAVRAPSSGGTIRQPYGAVPQAAAQTQRPSPAPPVGGRLAGVQSPATLSPAAVNSSGALPTPLLARHQQQQQQQKQRQQKQMPSALSSRLPPKQARPPANHDSLFIPKEQMIMKPTVPARQPSPAPPVPLSAAVRAKQQLQQHQQAQQQKQAEQQQQQAQHQKLAQQQRQQAQQKGEQAQQRQLAQQQAQQRQLAQQQKQGHKAARAGAVPASTPPPDRRQMAAVPAQRRQMASPLLALEECDIFADAEQQQQQEEQRHDPQQQQQQAGLKRASVSGGGGGGSGATQPTAHKRQKQQQGQQQGQKPGGAQLLPSIVPLEEVDLFDGL